jgi:hypothetical protein
MEQMIFQTMSSVMGAHITKVRVHGLQLMMGFHQFNGNIIGKCDLRVEQVTLSYHTLCL